MRNFFLKTMRLGFSTWEKDDLKLAISLWGDHDVTKLIDARGHLSEEQINSRLSREIENYNEYGVQYWPMFILETGEFIGCCGLRPYNSTKGIFEMGIHLRKSFWGQRYAYEATRAIIDYAFNELEVPALFAGHNPHNIASKKLLEKLGFSYTHDEFYPATGLNHPSYILRLPSS